MNEPRQKQIIAKRKKAKKEKASETTGRTSAVTDEKTQQKLKELDEFMEGVLQQAGQEFLDEFKQVEGE